MVNINYQRAENKNLPFSLHIPERNISFTFPAGINNMKSFENGGIVSKDQMDIENPRDIPVNLGGLNNSESMLKNRNLMLVQRYTLGRNSVSNTDSIAKKRSGFFGLSGTFSHILLLDGNRRTYSDESPGSGFYDTIYINNKVTFDSLYSRSIKNTMRFDFTTERVKKIQTGRRSGYQK